MTHGTRRRLPAALFSLAALGLLCGFALPATATPPAADTPAPAGDKVAARHSEDTTMLTSRTASGTFTVRMAPLDSDSDLADARLGRYSLEKTWEGDLEATSVGQMLTGSTTRDDSAVYTTIEAIEGNLQGRRGSFLVLNSGWMERGQGAIEVRIVPDSGTGDLTGIAGTVTLEVEGSDHRYRIDYTLPAD